PALAFGTLATASFEQVGKVEPPEVKRNALRLPGAAGTLASATGKAPEAAGAKACVSGTPASPRISLGRGRVNVVGVIAELIVDFPLLGIAQDVIGLGDLLELLFGRFVARVDVGMIFPGQLPERLADLIFRGVPLDPESRVIIFGLRGHWL